MKDYRSHVINLLLTDRWYRKVLAKIHGRKAVADVVRAARSGALK